MRAERLVEAPMARRDKEAPLLRVRTSHEITRYSGQWLAEAFERLLPRVEHRLARPVEDNVALQSAGSGKVKEVRSK
jgi:hypothetical protein